MREGVLPKIGIAAVVLFAPGGFLFGAALAAKWWRDRAAVAEVPSREYRVTSDRSR